MQALTRTIQTVIGKACDKIWRREGFSSGQLPGKIVLRDPTDHRCFACHITVHTDHPIAAPGQRGKIDFGGKLARHGLALDSQPWRCIQTGNPAARLNQRCSRDQGTALNLRLAGPLARQRCQRARGKRVWQMPGSREGTLQANWLVTLVAPDRRADDQIVGEIELVA